MPVLIQKVSPEDTPGTTAMVNEDEFVYPGRMSEIVLTEGASRELIVVHCNPDDLFGEAFLLRELVNLDLANDDTQLPHRSPVTCERIVRLEHDQRRTIELPDIGIPIDEYAVVLNHFATMTPN